MLALPSTAGSHRSSHPRLPGCVAASASMPKTAIDPRAPESVGAPLCAIRVCYVTMTAMPRSPHSIHPRVAAFFRRKETQFALLMVFALAIHLRGMWKPISIDEGGQIGISRGSHRAIATQFGYAQNHPLYGHLARVAIGALPLPIELSARVPALVAGMLIPWMFYRGQRRWVGHEAAVVVAFPDDPLRPDQALQLDGPWLCVPDPGGVGPGRPLARLPRRRSADTRAGVRPVGRAYRVRAPVDVPDRVVARGLRGARGAPAVGSSAGARATRRRVGGDRGFGRPRGPAVPADAGPRSARWGKTGPPA